MSYDVFTRLLLQLSLQIKAGAGRQYQDVFYKHNGSITPAMQLEAALRYFAGGSPLNIIISFGISHTEVLESWKYVVDAVNANP